MLSGVTAVLSILVSNVPAVLMIKPFVASAAATGHHVAGRSRWHQLWRAISHILGSIANLIVVRVAAGARGGDRVLGLFSAWRAADTDHPRDRHALDDVGAVGVVPVDARLIIGPIVAPRLVHRAQQIPSRPARSPDAPNRAPRPAMAATRTHADAPWDAAGLDPASRAPTRPGRSDQDPGCAPRSASPRRRPNRASIACNAASQASGVRASPSTRARRATPLT